MSVCHCGSEKLPGVMRTDLPQVRGQSAWCCGVCFNDFMQCPGESVTVCNIIMRQHGRDVRCAQRAMADGRCKRHGGE